MHIEFSYIPVAYPVILTIIQSYPHKIRMKKSVVAKEVRSHPFQITAPENHDCAVHCESYGIRYCVLLSGAFLSRIHQSGGYGTGG